MSCFISWPCTLRCARCLSHVSCQGPSQVLTGTRLSHSIFIAGTWFLVPEMRLDMLYTNIYHTRCILQYLRQIVLEIVYKSVLDTWPHISPHTAHSILILSMQFLVPQMRLDVLYKNIYHMYYILPWPCTQRDAKCLSHVSCLCPSQVPTGTNCKLSHSIFIAGTWLLVP